MSSYWASPVAHHPYSLLRFSSNSTPFMNIEVYTDGSALGNPGPGGWAARIHHNGTLTSLSGGEPYTTNNRMELLAVIRALQYIEEKKWPCDHIDLYSDSTWVVKTMTENWKRRKNLDLWAELDKIPLRTKTNWHWVKGHADHVENNACDEMARGEALAQQQNPTKPSNSFTPNPTLFS